MDYHERARIGERGEALGLRVGGALRRVDVTGAPEQRGEATSGEIRLAKTEKRER